MRGSSRTMRLLLVGQFAINVGFYMLMPYLADHLTRDLGLAGWLAGLILGVRNLSQQGMFLVGGSLADRLGCKPLILAGLVVRAAGFALLGVAHGVPYVITAGALVGLAGALFNPAVRAYLAHEAGERKVEAFALFNVYYQAGILVGPVVGLLLIEIAFQVTCLVAAALFALLAIAQAVALPGRRGERPGAVGTIVRDWRQALSNRAFTLFCLAMIGSYVLTFQVYLSLPIEIRRIGGGPGWVTALFTISGLLAIAGQVRLSAWVAARWTSSQAISNGLWLMGAAFVPLAVVPPSLASVLVCGALLTVATMIVYPFEMDTITRFGGQGMVGTYYGLYSTMSGLGIAAGNLVTGAAIDAGRHLGLPSLPWWVLAGLGCLCATAVRALDRAGRLTNPAHSGRLTEHRNG